MSLSATEIAHALGDARREGDGWRCRCPLADEHNNADAHPSLSLRDRPDGGVLAHCHSRHASEQDRVIEALKARGLWPASHGANARAASKSLGKETDEGYEFVSPVPPSTPDPDIAAKFLANKFGVTDAERFDYCNAAGGLLFSTYRFEPPGRKKEIFPVSLWRNRLSGKLRWYFKWPPKPLPLYGLDRLEQHAELPVLLLEGERKTDAAAGMLENSYVPVSLPGGARAIDKVDFALLVGRYVVGWPDNDRDGFYAMAKAARLIEGAQIDARGAITQNVRIIKPDPAWPVEHDIGDLIDAGWNAERLFDFIASSSVGTDDFERYARERFGKSDDLQRASGATAPLGVLACDVKAEPVRWLWSDTCRAAKSRTFRAILARANRCFASTLPHASAPAASFQTARKPRPAM
jgi:hypothetical protein